MAHGARIRLDTLETLGAVLGTRSRGVRAALAPRARLDLQAFDFLFPKLQDDDGNLLAVSPQTPQQLTALGQAMADQGVGAGAGDADIPAIYTYFGQFVDHDITLDADSGPAAVLFAPTLVPLERDAVPGSIRNVRTGTLDLDSLYGQGPTDDPDAAVPYQGDKLLVGKVTALNGQGPPVARPPGKDDDNDLPREPRNVNPAHDRAARIGDPRNDENTIVAQLHVAFLRAHNALVGQEGDFKKAHRLLRQHYQHIVVHDYLKRIADPAIVDEVVDRNRVFDPNRPRFFMPLEFSFAAFRFGHTMARASYNFNLNFNLSGQPGTFPASFDQLFTFTALTGQLGFGSGTDTLPDNWIAEWHNLVDAGQPFDRARRIDTKLAPPLFALRNELGVQLTGLQAHLAVRNLLRGYLLRMPTGQAVAGALGLPLLTPAEIEAAAGSPAQVQALRAGGFLERTPLWYYVLVEAAARAGGQRLGPVGSTIVAEVLVGCVRRSADSILKGRRAWNPSLPSARPNTFTLADLLRVAGVLA